MMAWIPRGYVLLLLGLPFVAVIADDSDDVEIARLVKQLGSTDFRMRDAATKRLNEIGAPALDALRKAATSNDVEARRRAEAIVVVIENKLYGPELVLIGDPGARADDPYRRNMVVALSVSADGKRVLTGSLDTLRLWDTNTGQCLRVFEGHTRGVTAAALAPDGKLVLEGSVDGTVHLWDATTGKQLRKYEGNTGAVYSVAFGPKGKAISGCSGNEAQNTMHLWDLNTGKKEAGVFPIQGHVSSVAYSDKARLAATVGAWSERWISLWDLETGKEVHRFTGPNSKFGGGVCFSPDGKHLLWAANDGALRRADVETHKELTPIRDTNAICAAFSPDGKRLVTGGGFDGKIVQIWDATTGKELQKYEGHTDWVGSVTFFPDGKRIASASGDGTVRIWQAPR